MALLLAAAFAGLGYRLVDLQVMRHDALLGQSQEQTQQTFIREPRRGDILDSKGNLLARSIFVKTVCANPSFIGDRTNEVARVLAPLLEMEESKIVERLRMQTFVNSKGEIVPRQYVVLKRKVAAETWEKIQAAMKNLSFGVDEKTLPRKEQAFYRNIRRQGVFVDVLEDQLRVYPNESLAAHILGFVGSDENESPVGPVLETVGKDGIELKLDTVLRGVRGWRNTEVIRSREVVAFREQDVEPHSGRNVILTIDARLQYIVETVLSEAFTKYNPAYACAIVVRPSTGEILALANYPTFNPNDAGNATEQLRRNRVITDSYEPGSTFKIVAIAAALNERLVTLENRFDCEGGRIFFAGRSLKDDHPAGILTVQEIIAKSSNIGTFKVAALLGPDRLYQYIRNFGFGALTDFPGTGEANGIVWAPKRWSKLSISRIPIGHGIAVTPLQMVMAMSAIANNGKLMKPMLINRLEDEQGNVVVRYDPQEVRQVVRPEVAKQMVTALKEVVSTNGTARRAIMGHYTVAGKTGTAEKPGPGGYIHGKYVGSFAGFFPADNPELCIAVVFDDPKPVYYGGATAAPTFREIAERAAKYMAIKPDVVPPTGNLAASQSAGAAATNKPKF